MSKLFITDHGRVLADHNEDITAWRWVRKTLTVPRAAAASDADLWVLAGSYPGNQRPLEVLINGRSTASLTPVRKWLTWHRVAVPAGVLRAGVNHFEFRCDTQAMNAWKLAIASPTPDPGSHLSHDQGKTWQNRAMGLYGVLVGEYVVRLRSHSAKLHDPNPPAIAYPDPQHPRLAALRELLPREIVRQRDGWKQMLALRTWVATQWSHDPFGPCYAPWDAATILDWAHADRGHAGRGKVTMCVHYAVAFTSFALALGQRARNIAISHDVTGFEGHFVAEVFDDQRGRWVLHDPNYDAHYEDGRPLSVIDISDRAEQGSVKALVVRGPGYPTRPARVLTGFRRSFATGRSYRLVSAWQRMDHITDPAANPGHHGSLVYCEPQWIWHDRYAELTAMFPWRGAAEWFTHA